MIHTIVHDVIVLKDRLYSLKDRLVPGINVQFYGLLAGPHVLMVDNYMNGELVIITEPKKDGYRDGHNFNTASAHQREHQPQGRQFNNNDAFHAKSGDEDLNQLNALLSQSF